MTYMQAALTVLSHADRPLTIGEITAVAVSEGLVRPRGKTPDRTMASVLYRRMAADADAPVISREGRFWLRGRPLPAAESAYLTRRARRSRPTARRARSLARRDGARRPTTTLPLPPLRLPDEVVRDATATQAGLATYAPMRRDHAVTRAGERGAQLLARLSTRRDGASGWDAARTDLRLVRPLLAHLRYRQGQEARRDDAAGRGLIAYLLYAGDEPAIALDVRRLGHELDDNDAWRVLGRAQAQSAPFGAVTNGRELRLYSAALVEAHDSPTAGLILTLDLAPDVGDAARTRRSAALWLLSRDTVAGGGLDAYALDCTVGRALLGALDAPDSPLARVLVNEVRAQAGAALPANLVLRHARLALRGRRGRDGEPLPDDVAAVAAVTGPRVDIPIVEVARSA